MRKGKLDLKKEVGEEGVIGVRGERDRRSKDSVRRKRREKRERGKESPGSNGDLKRMCQRKDDQFVKKWSLKDSPRRRERRKEVVDFDIVFTRICLRGRPRNSRNKL